MGCEADVDTGGGFNAADKAAVVVVPMGKPLPANADASRATAAAAAAAAAAAIAEDDCTAAPPADLRSPHVACCSVTTAVAVAAPKPAESTSSSIGSNSDCEGDCTEVSQDTNHACRFRRSLPLPPPPLYGYEYDYDYGYGEYPDVAYLYAPWHLHDVAPPCSAGAYAPPPPLRPPRPPAVLRHSSPSALWGPWGYCGGAAGTSSSPGSRDHSYDGTHTLSGGGGGGGGDGGQLLHTSLPPAMHSLPSCRYVPYGRPLAAMSYLGGANCTTCPPGSAAAAAAVAAARWSRSGSYGMPMPMPPPPPVPWLPSHAVQFPSPPPAALSTQQPFFRSSAPATTYSGAAGRPGVAAAAAATVSDGDAAAFTAAAAATGPQSQHPASGGSGCAGGAPKLAGCSSGGAPHILSGRPGGSLSQALPAMPYGYGGLRRCHSIAGRCGGSGPGCACSTCGSCVDVASGGGGGVAASRPRVSAAPVPGDEEAAAAGDASPPTQNGPGGAAAGLHTPLAPSELPGGPVRHSYVDPSGGVSVPYHRQVFCGPTRGDAPPPPPPPPRVHYPALRPGLLAPPWSTHGGSYDGQHEYDFGHGHMYGYEMQPSQDQAIPPVMAAAPAAEFSGGAARNAAASPRSSGAAAAGGAPPRPSPVQARLPCFEHVAWPRYPMTPPAFARALVHRHVPHSAPPMQPCGGPWLTHEP